MALSLNLTTNRKKERIDLLFSLVNVFENKFKEVNSLTKNLISGLIDGDGSFYVSFSKDGEIKPGFSLCSEKESLSLYLY
jgi:hypothetical protein